MIYITELDYYSLLSFITYGSTMGTLTVVGMKFKYWSDDQ